MQMGDGEMDSVVLALGQKKTLTKMQQEYEDLVREIHLPLLSLSIFIQSCFIFLKNCYCTPPRSGHRLGLDSDLYVVCEATEVAQSVLTPQIVSFLNKHASDLDSLHVSDLYTGYLPDTDDTSEVVVVRKTQKRIQMSFKREREG